MTVDRRRFPDVLRELALLPNEYDCIFEAGSIVRGWGNPSSDVDLYVITDRLWTSDTAVSHSVPLSTPKVPCEERIVDDTAWDIRYWTNAQVDEVLQRVSWDAFGGDVLGDFDDLSLKEIQLLERLTWAAPAAGDAWLHHRRLLVEQSAFRPLLMARALNHSDARVEDAVGQLKATDFASAVLSARAALHFSADALLLSQGVYGQNEKWLARRFQAADPELLPYEDYWAIETMRTYDPGNPEAWICDVLAICRKISLEVSIG